MDNRILADALAGKRRFVVYRVTRGEGNKLVKVPFDPTSGYPSNAQAEHTWMPYEHAIGWARHWDSARPAEVVSYGVGIAITPDCGFACLDIDEAVDANGHWLPHVVNFESRFPGAVRETSVSRRGRHVFIPYSGTLPAHTVSNIPYRMQFYSEQRFIGLTGIDADGVLTGDYTKALLPFLAEFFPEKPEPEHGLVWTSEPVAQWKGPADDSELIRRALRSHGVLGQARGRAGFHDLWNANADILARTFPSLNGRSAWDESAADQALANHLAFWCGNDCDRMLRIMLQCEGLARAKWEAREGYLQNTILNSCASQREWYAETPPPDVERPLTPEVAPVVIATQGVVPPTVEQVAEAVPELQPGQCPEPGQFCNSISMRKIFARHAYVEDVKAIQLYDGSTLTKEPFDVVFGGPLWAMTLDGKTTKSAWEALTMSEITKFPNVKTQYFRPDEETGTIRMKEGRREINSYSPADIRRIKGDPKPFLDLVYKMLPNGNDALILLYYMAACIRFLGKKFKWTVFLQGAKGNGKTSLAQVLEYCISHKYTHWAKADQLGEKFNSVFVQKLLVIVDEMYSDDTRELQEVLKQMVTAPRGEVRPMYGEKTMKDFCYNMMLMSNHQNGVRIDRDERRFAAMFCAQQSRVDIYRDGLTDDYFVDLHAWLDADGYAIVFDYLMSLEIPDEYNPATRCIRAPRTTSSDLAATASLGGIEQELIECVRQEHEGFRNGWISSNAVDVLLARAGREKSFPRSARKQLVTSLGYMPHPALTDDGLCTISMPDGSKPTLYVSKENPWNVPYLTVQQVRDGFLTAQKVT